MRNQVFTFMVGGKAGEGTKKAGNAASNLLASMGLRVFQMDDYQSLIKGGHNFSVVSASDEDISSHYMRADLVVNVDARSYDIHKSHVAQGGILVRNSDKVKGGDGLGFPLTTLAKDCERQDLILGLSSYAMLCAAIGMEWEATSKAVEMEYKRDSKDNLAYAKAVHDLAWPAFGGRFKLGVRGKKLPMLYGNEAIALGAAAGGLDLYVAYPMTPASSILHYLASHSEDLGVAVMHPENEIAVANIAIGAAAAGAKAMVGSSGGGFALMQEAISLAGMTETPLMMVLSSRPGPSTGVPTYTEQGDLSFAVGQGHGEFPKIVASPGTTEECFTLAAEMLDLAWKYQTPAILLMEKHMAESRKTVNIEPGKAAWAEPDMHVEGEYRRYLDTPSGVSPLLFPPSKELIKWDSYEHDEKGITTDEPAVIVKMHDKRKRKGETIVQHLKGTRTVNTFGDGDSIIFTYGSTTMSVLEALRFGSIRAKVVQPIYLEPLPVWELEKFRGTKSVVVEQSSTGQFEVLLRERAGVSASARIRKYDGRPFEPTELAAKLKEAL